MTFSRHFPLAATLALLCAAGCSDSPTFFPAIDVDSDAALADAGETRDGEGLDAETSETDALDAETPDGDAVDAADSDAEVSDTEVPDTGPTCGNDEVDVGELCDGEQLGASACQDFAFTGGTLACGSDCLSYDFTGCVGGETDPVCGNDEREAGEVCDGPDVGAANCQGFGFDSGTLTCLATCQGYEFAGCENDECVPDCTGRECGVDPICNQPCGSCGDDENCNDAGRCAPASGGAPVFIAFDTNVRRITDGQAVRFTAVVTDPDGIDDLIGGTLRDVESGSTYGSFSTSAAEGSYQIEVSWDDIHFVRPIDFIDTEPRVFEAEFFDTAANRVTQEMSIELFCAGGNAGAACGGQCSNISSTSQCGSCGFDCGSFSGSENSCVPEGDSFACDCGDEFTLCSDTCVDRFSDASCGEGCETCSGSEFCAVSGCAPASEGIRVTGIDILEIQYRGEWRGVCDDNFDALDGEVACRQLGGTLLEFGSGTGSADLWLDELGCTGDELRLADCPNAGWGNENCGATENVRIICSNTGTVCTQPAGDVYISEVFYDADGSDRGREFIELFAPEAASFQGTTLDLVNGDGSVYDSIELAAGASLGSGRDRWYLLGQSLVGGADQSFSDSLSVQNGPDAVVWRGCDGEIMDVAQYGFETPIFPDEGGESAPGVSPGTSLSRFYRDRVNALAFAAGGPTPGASNERPRIAPGGFSQTFDLTTGSGVFTPPTESCENGDSTGHVSATRTLNNPGRTLTVRVRAEHDDFDGVIFGYFGNFNSGAPTRNCQVGNDDSPDARASEYTLVWPEDENLVVLLTTASSRANGMSTITVTELTE